MRHRILYSVSCVGAVAGGRYIHARDDSVYVVLTFLGGKNTMTDIESIRLYSPLFASIRLYCSQQPHHNHGWTKGRPSLSAFYVSFPVRMANFRCLNSLDR